ncbi:MAG: DUF2786 domain-containing protein [Ruminococcus flavefaciens]|nr:DUF2786 domain-containing protein [Ruminococcus flavefaciens]
MNENENKIIDKIEKLISLAGSSNENEARAAMMKARELMAKYEIKREQLKSQEEERPVMGFTSGSFRDEWIQMVSGVIADNFRCRRIAISRVGSGGAFRIRFYGYEEDAEICINIFNYAVKVIRKRFGVLRAIYAEAKREFGNREKINYVLGFCHGLEKNFEEQKNQSQSFALALVTPKAVNDFVNALPGLEVTSGYKDLSRNREAALLQQTGYVDGKAFQNAGDAARLEN